MMLIQKPLYRPVMQKPYCCVPAVLSILMNRKKIKHGSQEQIGWELGLLVPKKDAHLFKKVRTGKKPIAGYGTQINKKEYSINEYFKKCKIRLKEKYYPIGDIKNLSNFIANNILLGNDIITCFNYKVLYGRGNYGHVSLVEKYDSKNKMLTLIDPGRRVSKRRKVLLSKLIGAMKKHEKEKRGGFWLISKH